MKQVHMSAKNKRGWNQFAYEAWTIRHGTPKEYAAILKNDPVKPIRYYMDDIGDIRGKRILNLLGSKGNKAVCFALLGADVTVIDISEANQKYALELADEAGVSIIYIVSDVVKVDESVLPSFDIIILEMGVLHYFKDLLPLFTKVKQLMEKNSVFILRDYHPFVSKVIQLVDGEMKINGDYFCDELVEVDVAYSTLLPKDIQADLEKNLIRKWTLSEIINSLIQVGLTVKEMKEDKGIDWAFPKGSPTGIANTIPGAFCIKAAKERE